ncbi:hypothetical protein EI94DRAFT_328765 [Lactarius quietus]|nr:hypothetical protein EI94DRAFT_328765 [Lactarius quietus]
MVNSCMKKGTRLPRRQLRHTIPLIGDVCLGQPPLPLLLAIAQVERFRSSIILSFLISVPCIFSLIRFSIARNLSFLGNSALYIGGTGPCRFSLARKL